MSVIRVVYKEVQSIHNILCIPVANILLYFYNPVTFFNINEGWKNNRESLAEISLILLPLPGEQLHSSQLSGVGSHILDSQTSS